MSAENTKRNIGLTVDGVKSGGVYPHEDLTRAGSWRVDLDEVDFASRYEVDCLHVSQSINQDQSILPLIYAFRTRGVHQHSWARNWSRDTALREQQS